MADNYTDNINILKEKAKQVKAMDLINPTSHTILLVTEIIERCKELPQLEVVDFKENNLIIDNLEVDA